MLAAIIPLLLPLALTTSPNPTSAPSYRKIRAYVTGYNTVPGQTDGTPCIAASGEDICGRRDTVACPRRIGLGTVVEIRLATYVCEDRLAPRFDRRFDISCGRNMACPSEVTGWTEIRVYDRRSAAAAPERRRHARRRRVRPISAGAPAMSRAPSSRRAARVAAAVRARKKMRWAQHAWNTRRRGSRISHG